VHCAKIETGTICLWIARSLIERFHIALILEHSWIEITMARKLLCCICLVALPVFRAPSLLHAEETLDEARRNYAVHFFDANAHIRLAKQLHDHGQRLAAVFVLEAATEHVPEDIEDVDSFSSTLHRVFPRDRISSSPKSVAKLRSQLRVSPNDFETLTRLADVYISRYEGAKAIPLLQKASKLRPDDYSAVAAMAKAYVDINEKEKGEAVISRWVREHPSSLPAYQTNIYTELDADDFAAPKEMVEEALKHYPDDALLHLDLGMVLERMHDLVGAQREFERAAALGGQFAAIQDSVAGFFWETKKDPRRALEYYLNAYFLDVDFHLTMTMEGHMVNIAREAASLLAAEIRENDANGTDNSATLDSLSPLLETVRLDLAKTNWDSNSMDTVLEVMGSDVEANRWGAMLLSAAHLNELSDDRLSKMLEDPDLRKRGMAGYLAVQRWHKKALPVMKRWLRDSAELIRFDAMSALVLYGDVAGRKMVEEYLASGKEPNVRLREAVKKALTNGRWHLPE
jgi:tetratricopeptide (TPR) repeat protein